VLIESLIVLAGIIAILFLANLVVKSTIRLAQHFGFSGTFIGLTILSIGTSIPEIMSAIVGSVEILKDPSTLNTISGLIVGQNVGSDIFQQSFILSTVGILGTVIVIKKNIYKEVGALILGAVIFWFFAWGGILSRIEGLILFLLYLGYLIYLNNYRTRERILKKHKLSKRKVALETIWILVGFIIMAFAASQVVNASTILVSTLPISASLFGVILLGIASALPEFTTAVVALLKKQRGISTGVLIGSNITNPLFGLGLGATISTYAIPNVVLYYDLPFKIGTALLILYFLNKHQDLKKWQGVVLIIMFIAYLWIRTIYFPVDF
jgi:cation:H+ antiporter